jgi:hypothetical protein
MKYRKKPVIINAFEWLGQEDTYPEWIQEAFKNQIVATDKSGFYIETLEGTMRAKHGDFIIQGVNGEIYPCKPEIFHQTYEKAD